jgi:hypothetical protein
VIPTDALQLAASLGFLVIGLRLILRSGQPTEEISSGPEETSSVDP